MKIALIHSHAKLETGAHFINDLISTSLRKRGVEIHHVYPRTSLVDAPAHLKGLRNILFFHSLLEKQRQILACDLVQGTTYTPLAFLPFNIPVVCHFGSTSQGFLDSVPMAEKLEKETRELWYDLKNKKVIKEVNIKTRRPIRNIAEIEQYVATRANGVIAASRKVAAELIAMGVARDRIRVIHNAIEDYWFKEPLGKVTANPGIVFIGRLGSDAFTLKLKGLDRLIYAAQAFPKSPKFMIAMTKSRPLMDFMLAGMQYCPCFFNMKKEKIPSTLKNARGSALFVPSRYEGFSLSLIEGMSQGLIPVSYPVGVAPEIIKNGQNGFLVKDLAEAKKRLRAILHDQVDRTALSANARKTAELFRTDWMTQQFKDFYYEVKERFRQEGGKRLLKEVKE